MIVQCDFDGTIITNNLSVLIRERFARADWRKTESDYVRGRLTVEQSNKQQYALIKESRNTLMEFARQNIKLRPGFLPFIEYCQATDIKFIIVSSGLDFYIEAVLDTIGAADLDLRCAQTSFGKDGIAVTYLDPEGNTIEDGFKNKHLTWLKKQGEPVIYIGDGLSDLDAASAADLVFAIDELHSLLNVISVPHYTFSNFNDIRHQIDTFRDRHSI